MKIEFYVTKRDMQYGLQTHELFSPAAIAINRAFKRYHMYGYSVIDNVDHILIRDRQFTNGRYHTRFRRVELNTKGITPGRYKFYL